MSPFAADAQRVNGAVLESVSGQPLAGAVVSALDVDGRPTVRALTNERGQYALVWQPGAVQLSVVRLGFHPVTLALAGSVPHDTTIVMSMAPWRVAFDGSGQSAEPFCSPGDRREAALELWNQARAGLLNSIVAKSTIPVDLVDLEYQTALDPATRRVTEQHIQVTQRTAASPNANRPSAAELAAKGYRILVGGAPTFFAPDPEVLFDETFLGSHCFGLKGDPRGHKGLIAVTFEPRSKGRADSVVDVRGQLWIDSSRLTVVQLDFVYTGVDEAARRAGEGGTVHFNTVRNGVVFVDRWSLILVGLRQTSAGGQLEVASIEETGASVLAAQWPDSTTYSGPVAVFRGLVSEKERSTPAANVLVAIDGVDSTLTDREGRFEFGLIPGGLYSVRVADTAYNAYSLPRTTTRDVLVGRGDTVTVNFEMPAFAQRQNPPSMLTGHVVNAKDHGPVPDADVWMPASDTHTRSDSTGRFRLTGLQVGKQFAIIRRLGFDELTDTITLRSGQELVRDFALEGQPVSLDTVHTTSRIVKYHSPQLRAFEERRQGGVGRYIAEDVMRKNDALSVATLLAARLPGMSIVGYKSQSFAQSNRAAGIATPFRALQNDRHSPMGCWLAVYVDGQALFSGPPGDAPDLSRMFVDDYAGAEFYPGGASVPAQFNMIRTANCGVLLLWTREFR